MRHVRRPYSISISAQANGRPTPKQNTRIGRKCMERLQPVVITMTSVCAPAGNYLAHREWSLVICVFEDQTEKEALELDTMPGSFLSFSIFKVPAIVLL